MVRHLFAFVCTMTASIAFAAAPSIESVAPGVGQRGTEFELRISGAGLAAAEEILFYGAGIVCRSLTPDKEGSLSAKLTAAADCTPGSHPFRIRTRKGLTELRTLRITPFPVIAASESNQSPATAQPIDGTCSITGTLEADDCACYRMVLRRGERLAAEVDAVRLGAGLFDTRIAVFGPDGTILAEVDDTPLFRQDPFVSLVAPADGQYVIQVCETNREADSGSRYVLHLGKFPRPQIAYPAGGQRGTEVTVQLLGDATGELLQTVHLPQETEGDFALFPKAGGETSPSPLPFRVSRGPNVLESTDASRAEPSTLPAAFNGVIAGGGERDRFLFRASAGEIWKFEVFADRIGSPLDAVVSISDLSGNLQAWCDDFATHDGMIEFAPQEDGVYELEITDKRENGGPLFVYRVEAHQLSPQLTTFLPRPERRSQERQAIAIPRGNRVFAGLAVRRTAVEGAVELSAIGLPQGVTMQSGPIPADRFWVPVVFSADDTAGPAGALTEVRADIVGDSQMVSGGFLQVTDLVAGPADALYHSSEVDRLAVAVTEPVPFKVQVIPPACALTPDGTLAIHIVVERSSGFDAPIDVTFPFLPPWVDAPPKTTIAAGENTGICVVRAWSEAEPRTWAICAEGRPAIAARQDESPGEPRMPRPRGRRSSGSDLADVRVSSELVALTLSHGVVSSAPEEIAGEQSQSIRLHLPLKFVGFVPDQLTATLEGLPNRVTCDPVTFDCSTGAVDLLVRLDETAPAGTFGGLVCRLSGVVNGQSVSWCVARGTTVTIARRGELTVDEQGRPISKLDALRRAKAKPAPTMP